MEAALRYAKYAYAAPVINAVLSAFPGLSRTAPPWKGINFASVADYIEGGDGAAENLVRLTGLHAGQSVVEIGMGIGVNATGLYRRFGAEIDYRGFDIVKYGVTWCRHHFAALKAKYAFTHADIFNSFYNPRGRINPESYRFPYEDRSTDVVFANSVFTHMQPPEVARYILESARILKSGGLAWFTFFCLEPDAAMQISKGAARYTFRHEHDGCRVERAEEPDVAVAYSREWIEHHMTVAGFRMREIELGSWRGRHAHWLQDIVVAERI